MKKLRMIAGRVFNDARRTASVNPTLTNYAQGIAAEVDTAAADFLMPEVETPSSMGQYKSYSDKNMIQIYDTARALGGVAERIKFDATDPTFNCKPHALEAGVDDSERDSAPDAGQLLDQSKVRAVVNATRLSKLVRVMTKIRDSLTAVPVLGAWTDPAIDPIKEINSQILAIALANGLMPNRLFIDLLAWAPLIDHPKVIARQPGAAAVGLTTNILKTMITMNPAIEIMVGASVYDQAKQGATKNPTSIGAGDVIIFYASQIPDQYDPSMAKCFTTKKNGVAQVRTYRDESARSDIHAIDWTEDNQVTSASMGRRIRTR